MSKSIAVLFLLTMSATQLLATVIPPIGLAPGSQYQMIFVTADMTTATSSDIGYYNSFVTTEAALNSLLPSATWHAVVSTFTGTDAKVNAPSLNLPVYNTQGIEVATAANFANFYVIGNVLYDQFGIAYHNGSDDFVWTGTDFQGINTTRFNTLGSQDLISFVGSANGHGDWLAAARGGTTGGSFLNDSLPIYALSTLITVPTPEPGTITLLGSALLVIGGIRFLRWRRG